jgi:hypothetical protein
MIAQLCDKVTKLANELDDLTAQGHARTGYAVLVRMRLAAMTVELVYLDLINRTRPSNP